MNPKILIIAEQIKDEVAPVTDELIAAAKSLRNFTDGDILILMTGQKTASAPNQLAEKTGLDILVVTAGDHAAPHEVLLKNLPDAVLGDLSPAWVIMAHTSRGLDAAPGFAAALNSACITGVLKISSTQDGICFTRSVFNDKISTRLMSASRTTVLTIAPGAFKPEPKANGPSGKISFFDTQAVSDAYEWQGEQSGHTDTAALGTAEVIVSAGNGVRKKEDLVLLDQLGNLFPKSAVAGSRPICDKKWLPYDRQVGITGATVAPKLYIACGISGASQHISGMRDAKFIVSINTDPHAAIFNISDICIIDDLTVFIPAFIAASRHATNRRFS